MTAVIVMDDSEKRCLLTPTSLSDSRQNFSFVQSAADVQDDPPSLPSPDAQDTPRTPTPNLLLNCPLIYSEPALAGQCHQMPVSLAPIFAISDTALPQMCLNRKSDSGIASSNAVNEDEAQPGEQATPKSSMYMSDVSFATSIAGGLKSEVQL